MYVSLCFFNYRYCLEFDWEREVICVNTLEPVTKFDKWWIGKHMCIEGINSSFELAGVVFV